MDGLPPLDGTTDFGVLVMDVIVRLFERDATNRSQHGPVSLPLSPLQVFLLLFNGIHHSLHRRQSQRLQGALAGLIANSVHKARLARADGLDFFVDAASDALLPMFLLGSGQVRHGRFLWLG